MCETNRITVNEPVISRNALINIIANVIKLMCVLKVYCFVFCFFSLGG